MRRADAGDGESLLGGQGQAIELPCQGNADAVHADEVYDVDVSVEHNETKGPRLSFHPRATANDNGRMTKLLNEQPNRRACCFNKLKHFRRFATHDERSKTCFHGLVALACSWIILQLYVDTGQGTGRNPVDKFCNRTLQSIR
jgi:hypothetical protein